VGAFAGEEGVQRLGHAEPPSENRGDARAGVAARRLASYPTAHGEVSLGRQLLGEVPDNSTTIMNRPKVADPLWPPAGHSSAERTAVPLRNVQ
jgi:hypothetical protein